MNQRSETNTLELGVSPGIDTRELMNSYSDVAGPTIFGSDVTENCWNFISRMAKKTSPTLKFECE